MNYTKSTLLFGLLFLLNLMPIEAKTVTLETGRTIFDRTRNIAIDEFDYIYILQNTDYSDKTHQLQIELEDGSKWTLESPQAETLSFYQRYKQESCDYKKAEQAVLNWAPGDHLIFHKITNRHSINVYNLEKDELFDVIPASAPSRNLHQITDKIVNKIQVPNYITKENNQKILTGYTTYRKAIISLSNGTLWNLGEGKFSDWQIGDAVMIAKDNPYLSSNTHVLINIAPNPVRQTMFKYKNLPRTSVQRN